MLGLFRILGKGLILLILAGIAVSGGSGHLSADEKDADSHTDHFGTAVKNRLKGWGYKSYGFHADVALTRNLDTGFGFGARIHQRFFHPMLELTPSIQFWGASNDSLDVYSVGFEESLTVIKTHKGIFYLLSGVTVGYYLIKKSLNIFEGHILKSREDSRNSFEAYLTIGSLYILSNNRAVFTQYRYGMTRKPYEMHILVGLNFFL